VTWLLLQVLDIVAPIIALPEWAPKLVLTLLVIGFPVAMLFAWAYELTPEGLKREKDVDRSQSITSHTGQRLDRIIIGFLVVTVAVLLVDKFFLGDAALRPDTVVATSAQPAVEGPSIAVLPFVNMSADASSTYFSDGLADTVLHMLAQVHQIRVAARTSSFQFRDQTLDISDIGKQLNVGSVLEGSVQRAGDKIRITAQLIDVNNGFHLWSGNFDRNLTDIFAVQDEIAAEVVSALKVSLLGTSVAELDSDQTGNVDAYTEYLLAVNDLNGPDSTSLTNAVRHLQEAVRLDPGYSRAWSTLARAYMALGDYGVMKDTDALAAAREAASRALDLSPDSSEAQAVLGLAELEDGNRDMAGQLLSKAIATGPNDAVAMLYYADYLGDDARPDESIAAYQKTLRLDPLSESAYLGLVNLHTGLGNIAVARETIAKLRSIHPASASGAYYDAMIDALHGNLAAAMTNLMAAQDLDPDDPESAATAVQIYLALDMPEQAKYWMDRAIEINPEHPVSRSAPLFVNYYLRQNADDNFRLARELLDEKIEDRRNSRFMALTVLHDHSARTGNYSVELEVLDNLYPHLFDDPPRDLTKNFWGTYFVGRALFESGDVARGSVLLRATIAEQDRFDDAYHFAHRVSVEARLLLGDTAGALKKFDTLASDPRFGLLNRALLENDRVFDPIRNEPQFVALLERRHALVQKQRTLLQAMNDAH